MPFPLAFQAAPGAVYRAAVAVPAAKSKTPVLRTILNKQQLAQSARDGEELARRHAAAMGLEPAQPVQPGAMPSAAPVEPAVQVPMVATAQPTVKRPLLRAVANGAVPVRQAVMNTRTPFRYRVSR